MKIFIGMASEVINRFLTPKKASCLNIFNEIYNDNLWGDANSRSGTGSNLLQTEVIREEIPKIARNLRVKVILDAPCGDYFWMKEIKFELQKTIESYIGIDIVSSLINNNNRLYADEKTKFILTNLVTDVLPTVDLVLSRDFLVHLSYSDIFSVLRNLKLSRSKYLLTTTFANRMSNMDTYTGDWRPLNLELPPFNFPTPICLINEKCTENRGDYSDKSLGLWDFENLPV